jgi:hypothetical protein
VNIPEPVSVYAPSPLPVVAAQPGLQVYGNLGIAQPVSVYLIASQLTALIPSEPPYQVYGSAQGVQVYGNVGVAQPVSVYFATPQSVTESNQPQPPFQVYGSAQGVQVYGNVGVAQPLSVYGQTTLGLEVYIAPSTTVSISGSQWQPPYQVYGSQPGVQVYTSSPLSVVAAQPGLQVYGNVGVAQPLSVYYATPQVISVQQPLSIYSPTKVGLQVYGNVNVFQPVAVYSAPNTPAVNIYDTQVVTDANQVFAGQIGAGTALNSQIVAPSAGLSLSTTLIDIWNIYGAAETVALRFGSAGQLRFIKKLNPNTGFVVNLINSTWRGPTNTGLYVYTWETMGGPLPNSGGFVTYTVMGQYLP